MITIRDILLGGAVPFAVALVVLLIGWRPWRRGRRATSGARGFGVVVGDDATVMRDTGEARPGEATSGDASAAITLPRGAWAGPVAIGAAFAAGYLGLFGRPPLLPTGASQWLFVLSVPLGLLGLLDALVRVPAWLTAILVALAMLVISWLLLERLVPGTFETTAALSGRVAALALPALVWWLALDALAARHSGAAAPLVFFIVAAGAAVVLLTSGSQTVGQMAGLIAAAVAAAVIVGWWSQAPVLARGAAVPFVVLTLGLLTYGRFYFDPPVPATNLLLLLVAPALAWLADQVIGRRVTGWRRSAAVVGAALLPVAIAVTLSLIRFVHEMSQTSYDGYSY